MRVMVVEDDMPLAAGVARMLEAKGHAVAVVSRNTDAILAAATDRFDLLILDSGSRGTEGFKLLKALRAKGSRMPVLVLAEPYGTKQGSSAFRLLTDEYVPRPFAMMALAATVRELAARCLDHSGERLVHGPLIMDTAAQRVVLAGKPIDLPRRQWAVLQVMLARAEQIVSKESIVRALDLPEGKLSHNAVEVYICRLRAKLAPGGIRLRTVRGFGYTLEAAKRATARRASRAHARP